jgi:DNA-binding IclR family transcriptional regulator
VRKRGPKAVAEEILRTYHHLRIVRALAQAGDASTKYSLQKSTGINPRQIARIINVLKKHGLVVEVGYSPKRYRLNRDNIHLQRLLGLLEGLGYL